MLTSNVSGIIICVVSLLVPQLVRAQGAIYVSDLGQASVGSQAIGSDAWYAAAFGTGTNSTGYVIDSIQLEMTGGLGNPSGFSLMIYTNGPTSANYPGGSVVALNGSLNPGASGIYTYSPSASFTLSPSTDYYLVLSAATPVVIGSYEWSLAGANSYNLSGGWAAGAGHVSTSVNGLTWQEAPVAFPEFAITATEAPEPSPWSLVLLGAGIFIKICRGGVRR